MEWVTATERNCATFNVERSPDGWSWEPLGSVSCVGNSQTRQEYTFTDTRPWEPVSYYRIRQVDIDGTVNMLPVVTMEACGVASELIRAWPNPVAEVLSVELDGAWSFDEGSIRVELLDATGRSVGALPTWPGEGPVHLDMSGMATGVYALVARGSDGTLLGHVLVVRE